MIQSRKGRFDSVLPEEPQDRITQRYELKCSESEDHGWSVLAPTRLLQCCRLR